MSNTYDHRPPSPRPLIEVAGWLARHNKGNYAKAVRQAIDDADLLIAERDSLRRRKEHFERTAYALETTLQACAQRLNCETGPQVVVELDKVLAERDAARAECERLTDRIKKMQACMFVAPDNSDTPKLWLWCGDEHDDSAEPIQCLDELLATQKGQSDGR